MAKSGTIMKDNAKALMLQEKDVIIDIFQKSDSWVLWFLGIAVAFFAFIASNYDKMICHLNANISHLIFICLGGSIVSGIIYRYVYMFIYSHKVNTIYNIIEDIYKRPNLPEYKQLARKVPFAQLVGIVEVYLDRDYSGLLTEYAKGNAVVQAELELMVAQLYAKRAEIEDTEITNTRTLIEGILDKYFGKTELEKKPKVPKLISGSYYKRITMLAKVLFVICILCFIICVIMFSIFFH